MQLAIAAKYLLMLLLESRKGLKFWDKLKVEVCKIFAADAWKEIEIDR